MLMTLLCLHRPISCPKQHQPCRASNSVVPEDARRKKGLVLDIAVLGTPVTVGPATRQANKTIAALRPKTTEESGTEKVTARRPNQGRVLQAYQTMRVTTTVMWRTPRHPPPKMGSASSAASIAVDVAIPMIPRTMVPLKMASRNTVGMVTSPRYCTNVKRQTLRPLRLLRQHPRAGRAHIAPDPGHNGLRDPTTQRAKRCQNQRGRPSMPFQGPTLQKRTQSSRLSQRSRNGHLMARPSSALHKTG